MRKIWQWLVAKFHRKPAPVPQGAPFDEPLPPVPTPVVVPPTPPVVTSRRIPRITDFTEVLAHTDFSNGTPAPWTAWGDGTHDTKETTMWVGPDTTGKFSGNVLTILYKMLGGVFQSSDQNVEFNTAVPFRYDMPLLMRMKVYIPKTVAPATTRKLIDFFTGGAPHPRLILHRTNEKLDYAIGQYEADGIWAIDRTQGTTGIPMPDDAVYDIAVMMLPNSADGVRDGVLSVWVNNTTTTPDFTLTGLSPITDRDGVAQSFFGSCRGGTQTTFQSTDPASDEYRYVKELGVYTIPGVGGI
jgi:hypothetical protein